MATIYETELQLFPKKCEVKLHEHLKNNAGRAETLKTGGTSKSHTSRKKIYIQMNYGYNVKF